MKIPLQEKIAELERRIEKLERAGERASGACNRQWDAKADSHWNQIWKQFDLFMGRLFGR